MGIRPSLKKYESRLMQRELKTRFYQDCECFLCVCSTIFIPFVEQAEIFTEIFIEIGFAVTYTSELNHVYRHLS